MVDKLQAVRGMNDVLPDESSLWLRLEQVLRDILQQYGYRNIRMPIVEPSALYRRSVGEHTDIVEKEIYTFEDKYNGTSLSLRPEGTAGCLRAVIEHNLLYAGPCRLWYEGAMFRHERPQKGRYRQFHQFGAEALGFRDAAIEAELLLMAARVWQQLGLKGIYLIINSIGDIEERRAYRAHLIAYLERHIDLLDDEVKRRLRLNPLRILDSKNPAIQDLLEDAPKLLDHLSPSSLAHFESLQNYLNDAGIAYTIVPRLVRGLDYYNGTVFEWLSDDLGGQATVCAGGRYDYLLAQLGANAAPACGLAFGVERLLMLMRRAAQQPAQVTVDVFLIALDLASVSYALKIAEYLRNAGLTVAFAANQAKLAKQMKRADNSGACCAVIVGEDERTAQQVSVKALRSGQSQQRCPWKNAPQVVMNMLKAVPTALRLPLNDE